MAMTLYMLVCNIVGLFLFNLLRGKLLFHTSVAGFVQNLIYM